MRSVPPASALSLVARLAAPAALAAGAGAQTLTFQVDAAASQFTWTGTSSLGPIVGNPSNQFHLVGTTVLATTLAAPPQAVASAAFAGGDAAAVPDLHGKIPNVLPFLPPLATIDVLGLRVQASSPGAAVAAGGAWTDLVAITALSGTLVVTPLGSAPTSTPLAGLQSSPSSSSGTLTLSGAKLRLVAPVDTTFPFSDPSTGASGSITLVGTLAADYALAQAYGFGDGSSGPCPCGNESPVGSGAGCLNSTGQGAKLAAGGLPSVSADSLLLSGQGMPATSTALYFQGTGALVPGLAAGDGLRTAGGTILRLGAVSNAAGASSFPPPGGTPLSVAGGVPALGTTLYYGIWYRDPAPGFCTADTYSFSSSLAVTWLP